MLRQGRDICMSNLLKLNGDRFLARALFRLIHGIIVGTKRSFFYFSVLVRPVRLSHLVTNSTSDLKDAKVHPC